MKSCLIIKIKLKVSSSYVLLNDWLAYFLFFAKPEFVSHIIREPIIVKLLISEIWFDRRILALSTYVSGKFFIKKENPHCRCLPPSLLRDTLSSRVCR